MFFFSTFGLSSGDVEVCTRETKEKIIADFKSKGDPQNIEFNNGTGYHHEIENFSAHGKSGFTLKLQKWHQIPNGARKDEISHYLGSVKKPPTKNASGCT